MDITKEEKGIIEKWLQYWGNDFEKAEKEWLTSKEKIAKIFPDSVSNPALFNQKVLQVVNAKLRNVSIGKIQKFKVRFLSMSEARDIWQPQRTKILEQFAKLKEEGKENEALALVNINDKTGEIIPKVPKLTSTGKVNQRAGENMPNELEGQLQTITGLTYIVDKDNNKQPKGFILTVNGKSCLKTFNDSDMFEIEAINRSKPEANVLILSTNDLKSTKVEDDFLKESMKLDTIDIVSKLFADKIKEFDEIVEWRQDGQIPKELSFSEFIVRRVQVISMNLKGNKKGNSTMFVDRVPDLNSPPTSDEKTSFYCGFKEGSIDIKFAEGSVVMIIGSGYIFKDRETGENIFNFTLSGAIPYEGEYIPAIEAQEISENDLIGNKPIKEQPKKIQSAKIEQPKVEQTDDPWN